MDRYIFYIILKIISDVICLLSPPLIVVKDVFLILTLPRIINLYYPKDLILLIHTYKDQSIKVVFSIYLSKFNKRYISVDNISDIIYFIKHYIMLILMGILRENLYNYYKIIKYIYYTKTKYIYYTLTKQEAQEYVEVNNNWKITDIKLIHSIITIEDVKYKTIYYYIQSIITCWTLTIACGNILMMYVISQYLDIYKNKSIIYFIICILISMYTETYIVGCILYSIDEEKIKKYMNEIINYESEEFTIINNNQEKKMEDDDYFFC